MSEVYYNNPTSFPYIERAILVERISLPRYEDLKNVNAQFYIPVLMPKIQESSSVISKSKSAPSKIGFKGQNINASGYSYSNAINLIIPKYILIQFYNGISDKNASIPKGTEFLVACVGGIMDIDLMRIIGLYTV